MSVKKQFRGLTFNYNIGKQLMRDKYETIEEFVSNEFSNKNPLAPKLSTEIFNIRWNRNTIKLFNKVKTISDLLTILNGEVVITNTAIRLPNESQYERKSIISIEEVESVLKDIVLNNIDTPKKLKHHGSLTVTIDGEEIYALSDRYKLFFTKGYTCINCGLIGSYFALERSFMDTRYHLNLYAVNSEGKEVLMTKDHILPKSKGGKDSIDNYQTMCCKCNKEKGNNVEQKY